MNIMDRIETKMFSEIARNSMHYITPVDHKEATGLVRQVYEQMMRDLSLGPPLTVHSLATLMISKSDNTATDHLLYYAGRTRIEEMMSEMGNEHSEKSIPFLSTLEMFKLKSNRKLRKQYLNATIKERRELLAGEVRKLSRKKVVAYQDPREVEILEWFASAADLCRLMNWFREKNNQTALDILAVNSGLTIPKRRIESTELSAQSPPIVLRDLNLNFQ